MSASSPGEPRLPEPHENEDGGPPPRRSRWGLVLIILIMMICVGGLLVSGWRFLQMHQATQAKAQAAALLSPAQQEGLKRLQESACLRCHQMERPAVGPSFQAIAERHAGKPEAQAFLADKIRNGSVGDWGRVIMPRHLHISDADARLIADWVLTQRPKTSAPAPVAAP